ncbi:keratocan [Pantherophis guttatus]|uniref:Keratocan n=1 Tax=Pantherophis guttatus TaxID=94885 RepID=A0A6P9AQE2_PANGU|nr:keratocan [Pantherophis guttatus]
MNIIFCSSLLVSFLATIVWTRTIRTMEDESDPYNWLFYTFECPQDCFCPPNFPNALYCDSKAMKEIPAIPPGIWYLYLQNNLIEIITEKSFVNATQLKWINLNNNKITTNGIEKGAFNNLKSLLYLYLEDNYLEEVPDPLPRSLEQLRLARNKIRTIPQGVFNNLENLTMLDLHQNKLLDNALSSNTFQGLSSLMQLNVAQNSLTKMPPILPANVNQLFLDSNSIEAIPENYFDATLRLVSLRLNHNKLTDGGVPSKVFNISSLLDLQLSYNELTIIPAIGIHLEHLYLDNNRINSLNGTQVCPIPIPGDYVYESNLPQLRYLRLDGNGIKPPIPLDLMLCFRLLRALVI